MFKRKWIIPLILILALALAACTDNETPPEDENPINQEEGEVTDTNTEEEPQVDENDSSETSANNEENTNESNGEKDINTEYVLGDISKEDAYDAFNEEFPGIKVHKIEMDKSDYEFFYKVKGFDGSKKYKIWINIEDGSKDKEEKEDDKTVRDEITKDHLGKINEFLRKALDEAGEGYMIHEWELESKDKGFILEIETVDENKHNKKEYEYNIETGELIDIDD